ncbi:hypothetical protein JCM33374_g903 [Metschnikowia sp. JCM 33374]|nr:hypothetical protein JCM33374_g903 [Metschnikowia sp. JCM 33374]
MTPIQSQTKKRQRKSVQNESPSIFIVPGYLEETAKFTVESCFDISGAAQSSHPPIDDMARFHSGNPPDNGSSLLSSETAQVGTIHPFLPTQGVPTPTEKDTASGTSSGTASGLNPKVIRDRFAPAPLKSSPESENAEKTFETLLPSLQKVNPRNFGSFLSEVLRSRCEQVPLDVFYHLLYNSSLSDSGCHQACSVDKSGSSEVNSEGVKLYRLVIDTLKNPQNAGGTEVFSKDQASSISSVNLHELLRTFLAMKIVFSSLEKVQDPPRPKQVSTRRLFQQNLMLSSSNFGKIPKLLYPGLVTKRIGSRGNSKYHYFGLRWSPSLVDQEIRGLLNLEMPALKDYFHKVPFVQTQEKPTAKRENVVNPPTLLRSTVLPRPLPPVKPAYSHVSLSTTYPEDDCSPRIWKGTPNSIPQHSKWAKDVMERSMKVLEGQDIDLEPLRRNINGGIFSENDHNSLSGTVSRAMKVLSSTGADKTSYLHLYLAVSLMLFPVILASDQEVPCASKHQLRACVTKCVTELNHVSASLSCVDVNSLGSFTRTLRKMVHINELEEIIVRATIVAINAYHFEFSDGMQNPTEAGTIGVIASIAKAVALTVSCTTDNMSNIPLLGETDKVDNIAPDVPYQIFKLSMPHFHEKTLSYPIMKQLPIPIIIHVLKSTQNEIQNASLSRFACRETELSKETFKSWWVLFVIVQEYLDVLSEVVALSQML